MSVRQQLSAWGEAFITFLLYEKGTASHLVAFDARQLPGSVCVGDIPISTVRAFSLRTLQFFVWQHNHIQVCLVLSCLALRQGLM